MTAHCPRRPCARRASQCVIIGPEKNTTQIYSACELRARARNHYILVACDRIVAKTKGQFTRSFCFARRSLISCIKHVTHMKSYARITCACARTHKHTHAYTGTAFPSAPLLQKYNTVCGSGAATCRAAAVRVVTPKLCENHMTPYTHKAKLIAPSQSLV